jgi:hypothetical protein
MRNNDLRNTTQKPKIKQTLNTLQIKIFQLIRPHPLLHIYIDQMPFITSACTKPVERTVIHVFII